MTWTRANRATPDRGAADRAPDLGHLRLDAAGDHAQLHGSPGAFAAGDRDQSRSRSEQRGLCRLETRLRPRVRRRRDRHRARRRPDQPAMALPGGPAGLVARRVRDRLGHDLSRAARLPSAAGFLRGRPVAVCAGDRAALLSRRDRPLGNSILQSGASLGAIATPIVVLFLAT